MCALALIMLSDVPAASAQQFELTPFGGYRFLNDVFEVITGRSVDRDGAPSVGATFDVPLGAGTQVEALYSFQQASIELTAIPEVPAQRVRITVQHFLAGALQEFGEGRVRPFVAGYLGLTNMAGAGESETRFTLAGGGGVKLYATQHVGARLDGRLTSTFVDADAFSTGLCGPRGCLVRLDLSIAWQIEFAAGVIVSF